MRVQVKHQGQTRTLSPEEISAEILKSLKKSAEAFLGLPVSSAVITVPAYFSNVQREATLAAGQLAGLKVHISLCSLPLLDEQAANLGDANSQRAHGRLNCLHALTTELRSEPDRKKGLSHGAGL